MTKTARILIVDDETAMRECLRDWLMEDGYEVGMAPNGKAAVAMADEKDWDLILLDLKMPEMDGIETLAHLQRIRPEAQVIIMTAYASVDTAIEAMKKGAFDYLVKPFNPDEIELQIKKIMAHRDLVIENILLKEKLSLKAAANEIIGQSQAMQAVFDMIEMAAPTAATVLITGESGTGKELIAQAIHGNSQRCYQPFIAVNCGALPDSLLESELFGYEKGAFTGADHTKKGRFELADGGTLFLDEIGEISPKTQVNLLRVLQQKEFQRLGGQHPVKVDVRIIAATNRDLHQAIASRQFREDLFYRLNVISLPVPPLRERKEDIPLLVDFFIQRFAMEMNRERVAVAPAALKALVDYHWPGNVRELENVIERAMVIGRGRTIVPQDLPFSTCREDAPAYPTSLKRMEEAHIRRVLVESEWNIRKAARLLEIDRQTLYNKMKRLAIQKPE